MTTTSWQAHEAAGRLHVAAGQFHPIVGRAHAPAGQLGWLSYSGTARVVLAVVLVIVASGAATAGLALRAAKRLPSPGRAVRKALLATWGAAIAAYLVCHSLYTSQLMRRHLIRSIPPQPIFPITVACMITLFAGILYIGRSLRRRARLGSACLGAMAGLMIFQIPFDLIIMTRVYPAAPDPLLYWGLISATLLVEVTTLALLSLSPLVRLSGRSFLAVAMMLLIFAIWALARFGQPSAPIPFAINAASEVVAFVVALSLFPAQRGQHGTLQPTKAPRDSLVPEAR